VKLSAHRSSGTSHASRDAATGDTSVGKIGELFHHFHRSILASKIVPTHGSVSMTPHSFLASAFGTACWVLYSLQASRLL
jgi:uncharacterized protein with PQ loop repeat